MQEQARGGFCSNEKSDERSQRNCQYLDFEGCNGLDTKTEANEERWKNYGVLKKAMV